MQSWSFSLPAILSEAVLLLCCGGGTTRGPGGPFPPLWWLAVLREGLVLADGEVVRSRPSGGWPFYARVWFSPLLVLRSPFGAAMLGIPSFMLDVCWRRWLSSPAFLFDVKLCASCGGFFAGGPILPLAGCSTQGLGVRRSVASFFSLSFFCFVKGFLITLYQLVVFK